MDITVPLVSPAMLDSGIMLDIASFFGVPLISPWFISKVFVGLMQDCAFRQTVFFIGTKGSG